jgi:hypothetical protein
MARRASPKKILDPTGTGAAENMNMALRGPPGKQTRQIVCFRESQIR